MYNVKVKFLKGHEVTYQSESQPQYGHAPYLVVGGDIIPLVSVESFQVTWNDAQ